MSTKPIDEILPREPDPKVKEVLDLYANKLDEIINFSTYILKWDIEKSSKQVNQGIISLFLRNIIELTDSVSILLRQSSIDPAFIIMRSILENYLNILYFLDKNEEKRLRSFMVWKSKKDIKYYKQFLTREQSNSKLRSELEKDHLKISFDKFFDREEINKQRDRSQEILVHSITCVAHSY